MCENTEKRKAIWLDSHGQAYRIGVTNNPVCHKMCFSNHLWHLYQAKRKQTITCLMQLDPHFSEPVWEAQFVTYRAVCHPYAICLVYGHVSSLLREMWCTVLVLRMAQRKWKEIKQQPSMLPGPAVPGCCLVSFHFLCYILCSRSVPSSPRKGFDKKFEKLSVHIGQSI